jgi:TonB family protein
MTVTVNFTLDTGRSTGGAPGGVTGGVTGGVAGGVTGSVAGGVTGGVPKAVKREPPRRIYYVAPAYPDDARAQGVQGVAILQVTIETDGAPSDVKVIRGDVLLAQSAIDAVQQWRWTPPAKAVVATVTVRFALDDAKVAAEAVGPSSGHPRVVREVKPLYPPDLLKAKMAGAVTVEAIVGTDGRVLAARVLKGSDVFHQAALDAVRQWEFEPPDRPVKVAIDLTFSVR